MTSRKSSGKEIDRLETIARQHRYGLGFNGILMDYRFQAMRPFIRRGARILELGPAEGHMTRHLLSLSKSITAVDGSSVYLSELRKKFPGVRTVEALFEDADIQERYSVILMPHILEHVKDPVGLLRKYKENLTDKGHLIISVPNAYSLNRLLGVEMGLLRDPHDLDRGDIAIGHRRVYDPDTLAENVCRAGLKIIHQGGVFLKLLSNAQMERVFTDKQIEGMNKLGRSFPRHCTELLCVCERKKR